MFQIKVKNNNFQQIRIKVLKFVKGLVPKR